MEPSTASMLTRVAARERAAVRECMASYGGLIWYLARRLSQTLLDAEDATQEIFMDIWRSAGRYDPALGSEKIFIMTIARRRLIDRLHEKRSKSSLDSSPALEIAPLIEPCIA
jgi:RNA polymerase sigma-70 factor, ECF subfamily